MFDAIDISIYFPVFYTAAAHCFEVAIYALFIHLLNGKLKRPRVAKIIIRAKNLK